MKATKIFKLLASFEIGKDRFDAFWDFTIFAEDEGYKIDWNDLRKYESIFYDLPFTQIDDFFTHVKHQLFIFNFYNKEKVGSVNLLEIFSFEHGQFFNARKHQ